MINELARAFHTDGYTTISDLFPQSIIADLYDLAMGNFWEVHAIITDSKLDFGVGIKHGFNEIVQRHPHRFEMPYKMDDNRFDFVLRNEELRHLVATILDCDDFIVANRSLVVSEPGCMDQAWHSDGPHVSATQDLPCHVLNVFIPLVDVTASNGPTEFRPGSHYYTRDLAKLMLIAKLKKQLRPVDAPCLRVGSALLVRVC